VVSEIRCERQHAYRVLDQRGALLGRECFTPGQALVQFVRAGDDAHEIRVAHLTNGTPCPAKQQRLAEDVAAFAGRGAW
jgi:hypothetical protein